MSPTSFRSYSTKLFFTLLVRKNLYLNFFITSFSQYTTICFVSFVYSVFNEQFRELCSLVGPSGLEPPTSCLSGTRSNLLSYEPMWLVSDFSSLGWWRWWDSNPWPPACRAGALPAELHPHIVCIMHIGFCFLLLLRFKKGSFTFLSFRSVGIELSSRTVSRKVFSPLQSLTSVFGMGTGGPSAFVTPTIQEPLILENWTTFTFS